MAKVFNPSEVLSVKTNITPAKSGVTRANLDFLVRRTARDQRRARRSL